MQKHLDKEEFFKIIKPDFEFLNYRISNGEEIYDKTTVSEIFCNKLFNLLKETKSVIAGGDQYY